MSMMRMVIRAMAATKVMVTAITALVGARTRAGVNRWTTSSALAAASFRHRRRRAVGSAHSIGLIGPQYLPALVQARSLRLRMGHVAVTTYRRR